MTVAAVTVITVIVFVVVAVVVGATGVATTVATKLVTVVVIVVAVAAAVIAAVVVTVVVVLIVFVVVVVKDVICITAGALARVFYDVPDAVLDVTTVARATRHRGVKRPEAAPDRQEDPYHEEDQIALHTSPC
jgi:hypothetical protein